MERDQSMRWSVCSPVVTSQPATEQVGLVQSKALTWWAVGRRPKWATVATSTPLVTTAARNASPLATMSRTTATGTGPRPAISHTSPSIG